uniref:Uncharacterized protein n=1 Tax=Picea glauca TaxID=3330 RepID=A0A101LTM8_PICGL|nr:hypothetical protein ABT39_MTgene3630 [Picea glauca]
MPKHHLDLNHLLKSNIETIYLGLTINHSKSLVHYWGLTDVELLFLKDSIPLTFIYLSEGFTYLGFQMKLGVTSLGD